MMMADAVKLHSSGYADIFLKDGICTKKMYGSQLYPDYHKRFYNFIRRKDYYVKILEIKDSFEYSMEYLDIYSTVDRYLHPDNPNFKNNIQEDILEDILRVFLQIQIDCVEFSKTLWKSKTLPAGQYWVHEDVHLLNFVITKDRKIKLIDIDSFAIAESPLHFSYIDTFAVLTSRLQDAYDTKRALEA